MGRTTKITTLSLAAAALACAAIGMLSDRSLAQGGSDATAATTRPGGGDATPAATASTQSPPQVRHPGLDPFLTNCASCHTVGAGQLAGPDLMGVKSRIPSREWALEFVKNPAATIAKDAYAKALRAKYPMDMSPFGHLGDRTINDILDFIEAGGPGIPRKATRESTAADVALGRELFLGETRFASGAPACLSCHEVEGTTGFGGGNLAASIGVMSPSLTAAATRNGGENGLRAALAAPQFPVMREVFARTPLSEDEVIAVSAFLAQSSRATETTPKRDVLLLWGVLGALALVVVLDVLWIRRFRNVRKTLVGGRS